MYRNLSKILNEKTVTTKALSVLLDVTEKTALNKIRGETDFSMAEALKIQAVICPEYRMEYVFAATENENALCG